MNLVIDIGNTRSKYAFFQEDRLIGVNYRLDSILEDIRVWKEKGEKVWIFLTGSGHIDSEMQLAIKEQADYWLEASPALEVPLKIGYATPETLGFDRIAICVGAKSYYPGASLLVIDSGTCITYNYVSAEGVFLGGNISPGLEMRFNGRTGLQPAAFGDTDRNLWRNRTVDRRSYPEWRDVWYAF